MSTFIKFSINSSLNTYKEQKKSKFAFPSLLKGLKKTGGRNNSGKITAFHRGGGHKQKKRDITFNRQLLNDTGTVTGIEYDPNRSAFIASVIDNNNKKYYVLATKNMIKGDVLTNNNLLNYQTGEKNIIQKEGSYYPLKLISIGKKINSINIRLNQKAKLVRSAGTSATLIQKKNNGDFIIELPSLKRKIVSSNCGAVLGSLSNNLHNKKVLKKAGARRWLGKRPHVRGVAMNPVDHPHGGGEGKTSGGRPSVSPQGRLTKGWKSIKK